MRVHTCFFVALLCMLSCAGCSKQKSTDELLEDLKTGQERERIIAGRTLPHRKGDAAQVVPALIKALRDPQNDLRLSAAIGLGEFGEQAKDAIPALQKAQKDRHPAVRAAATKSLSRIDPVQFPPNSPGK